MSYQFGTNWSRFSEAAGNVIGPLLGYEVLTAFFLEATFLGIMLFGTGRVNRGLHFLATVAVAVGTLISTFWIMSANSRSEEHTSELQSLMRISYAVFCLKKKKQDNTYNQNTD